MQLYVPWNRFQIILYQLVQVIFLILGQLTFINFSMNSLHFIKNQVHFLTVLSDFWKTSTLLWTQLGSLYVIVLELMRLDFVLLNLLQVFLELLFLLWLLFLQHFLVLSFFDAFFIALHDDGNEDVLDCRIEKDHKNNQVNLTR